MHINLKLIYYHQHTYDVMTDYKQQNYQRIAIAIEYIKAHFKDQPSLDELASVVDLSPSHFQRLFTEWAGVSPKKFIQYLSLDYSKKRLKENQQSISDTAYSAGLSGSSRLHDLFVTFESMTPGEYKKGGENLSINYSFAESPFGKIIIASTPIGICHIAFEENENKAIEKLISQFPQAMYEMKQDSFQQKALNFFNSDWNKIEQIKLHLKGTEFQLKVWQTLLTLPLGNLTTYGSIAHSINRPKASRAVGTAIGSNPIAFLIPCHRVIQQSGNLGGYMWGETRKSAIIGWEAATLEFQ